MGINRLAAAPAPPPPTAPAPTSPPAALPPPPPPLVAPIAVYTFANALLVVVEHNQGRAVLAQIYDTNGRQMFAAIQTVTPNKLNVIFTTRLSGTVVIS